MSFDEEFQDLGVATTIYKQYCQQNILWLGGNQDLCTGVRTAVLYPN